MIQTYTDILNEKKIPTLIKHAESDKMERAKLLEIEYQGIKELKDNITFEFHVVDPNGSGKARRVFVQFRDSNDYTKIAKILDSKENFETSVSKKNIRLHCSCPSFKYGGYKFIGTLEDYSIYSEDREPEITNPHLEGTLCKHGLAVVERMKDYYEEIMDKLIQQELL